MWIAETTDVALFGSMRRFGDLGVHGVVDLKRSFTKDDLTRALAATIQDFPVLGCLYQPRFYRDRWVPARAPIEDSVRVESPRDLESATRAWTRAHIDPTRERPLRVVQLAREGGSRLIVSLSHVAVDGAGMGAVGHVFGSHLYGQEPALPVEKRRDLGRALDALSWYHAPIIARDTLVNAVESARVFLSARREQPYMRPQERPKGDSDRGPFVRQICFEPADLKAIQARAGGQARVNDILLAAFARATAKRSRGGSVPVLYTMDLRRFTRSPYFSAANTSAILSVVLDRSSTCDLRTAAEAVRKITEQHQKSLVGPAFALAPTALGGRLPHGLLRKMVPLFHAPVVDVPIDRGLFFTNVGRLDRGLSPFLEDIESLRTVGPNVKGVQIPVVVAFGLRGRLYLELFAPPGVPETSLEELTQEIYEALEMPQDTP